MTTPKRIRLYIYGFLIGCVMVYFMLFRGNDRSYWLPANRVKEQVNKSTFKYSEHARCKMQCKQISEKEVAEILKARSEDGLPLTLETTHVQLPQRILPDAWPPYALAAC